MPPKRGRYSAAARAAAVAAVTTERRYEVKVEEIKIESPKFDENFPELDAHEYELRMNSNIRKIIAAETQFNKTVQVLKKAKLHNLQLRRQEIQDGVNEEFIWRKSLLEKERDRKLKIVHQWRNLELDRIQRRLDAVNFYGESSHEDGFNQAQERLVERLELEELALLEELKQAQMTIGTARWEEMDRKKTERNMKRNGINKKEEKYMANYGRIAKYRKMLKYPLIVYQLKTPDIEADLDFCRRAILEKDIDKTLKSEENLEAFAENDPETEKKFSLMYHPRRRLKKRLKVSAIERRNLKKKKKFKKSLHKKKTKTKEKKKVTFKEPIKEEKVFDNSEKGSEEKQSIKGEKPGDVSQTMEEKKSLADASKGDKSLL